MYIDDGCKKEDYIITKVYLKPQNKRFLGNSNPSKMDVHDLHSVTVDCQITEIFNAGHAVIFTPDTLEQDHLDGYDNCAYCIGNSKR